MGAGRHNGRDPASERNGDVTAERELELLVIPGELLRRTWFRPYAAAAELVSMLGRLHGP